jgi:hypothetical protein
MTDKYLRQIVLEELDFKPSLDPTHIPGGAQPKQEIEP